MANVITGSELAREITNAKRIIRHAHIGLGHAKFEPWFLRVPKRGIVTLVLPYSTVTHSGGTSSHEYTIAIA